MENMDLTKAAIDKPLICIRTLKEHGNYYSLETTLDTLGPQYVILYHSDVAAVRQLETHECRKPDGAASLAVYLMLHDRTVEEQAYLTALKREKQAFEHLIQTKSVMVVPTYQDGRSDEVFTLNTERPQEAVDTRKAGGQKSDDKGARMPLVVVDMREFRSDLPALLHARGVHIHPLVISVGDYILTPDMCVERKSISDLIGSLNSGRLYTQCTHMCRYYSRPILLIEFDQNKPFNLQANLVLSWESCGAEVLQKLQLLTIHFPRLKLVWSPSPYATAELFYELKQGRADPSATDTLALQGQVGADDISHERYNSRVHDFLRVLPGVTHKNIARLMNRGRSLQHLITLPKVGVVELVESRSEGETLHTALHVRSRPGDLARGNKHKHKHNYTNTVFRKHNPANRE